MCWFVSLFVCQSVCLNEISLTVRDRVAGLAGLNNVTKSSKKLIGAIFSLVCLLICLFVRWVQDNLRTVRDSDAKLSGYHYVAKSGK